MDEAWSSAGVFHSLAPAGQYRACYGAPQRGREVGPLEHTPGQVTKGVRSFIKLCFSMLRINGCKDEDQLAGFAKVHPVNWPTSAGVLHSHCELDGNFWDCLGYWVKGKSISMTTSAITAKAILWPNVIKEMSQIGRDCARLRTGRLMIKTLQEHHWYPSTEHGISEEPRRH